MQSRDSGFSRDRALCDAAEQKPRRRGTDFTCAYLRGGQRRGDAQIGEANDRQSNQLPNRLAPRGYMIARHAEDDILDVNSGRTTASTMDRVCPQYSAKTRRKSC